MIDFNQIKSVIAETKKQERERERERDFWKVKVKVINQNNYDRKESGI